jgi:hypothetical protein
MPRLPFDCIRIIAQTGISQYRALLALMRFGRLSLVGKWQMEWQDHFTICRSNILCNIDMAADGRPPQFEPGCATIFTLNDKFHRRGGPAVTIYYNGKRMITEWYLYDQLHRDDDYAVILYSIHGDRYDGEIINCYRFRYGRMIVSGWCEGYHHRWYLL